MEIKVFGPGCAKCEETYRIMAKAVEETGSEAKLGKVTDFKEMMANGVMSTPAVSINGKVMCTGRVPTKKEAAEWVKVAK